MNAIARSFCFTLNADRDFLIDVWCTIRHRLVSGEVDTVNQFIANFETAPTTGQHHIQGHIDCNVATRPTAIVGLFPELGGAHWEPVNNLEASREYCRKEETAWDHAEWIKHGYTPKGAGRARDGPKPIDTMYERLADMVAAGKTWNQIQNSLVKDNPRVFGANSKQLQAAYVAFKAVPDEESDINLRPWQKAVVELTAATPDGRTVNWIYDPVGNVGKSFLCKYLVTNHGAIMLDGRVQDMAYAYQGQRIVCIDIARAQSENMDHLHVFAEKVASGNLFSSKYEACNKVFDPPHVFIFANVHHHADKWTDGRCKEFDVQAFINRDRAADLVNIAMRFM